MRKSLFISAISTCFAMILCVAGTKNAQAQQCTAPYEMITQLHFPRTASYTVWNAVNDEKDRQGRYSSAVMQGESVLAVGVLGAEGERKSMIFTLLDERGRIAWSKEHKLPGLIDVVKMIDLGEGRLAVLVNREDERGIARAWLGFFDANAKFMNAREFAQAPKHVEGTDIVKTIDGKNLILSTSITQTKGADLKYASLSVLDYDGQVKFKRQIILGNKNEITSLNVSKIGGGPASIIATGYFENNFGKATAFVGRLNDDLTFLWQKEFRRGQSAILKKSVIDKYGQVLVGGQVMGGGDDFGHAVWLGALDARNGDLKWQRYYAAQEKRHHYDIRGLDVNEDGVVTSLMQATRREALEEPLAEHLSEDMDADYIRLLRLSPRGITLSGDTYHYHKGAQVNAMIEGRHGHYVMLGSAQTTQSDRLKDQQDSALAKLSQDKVGVPLREKDYVRLPEADVSDETKKGLALLKKNMDKQAQEAKDEHEAEPKNQEEETVESLKTEPEFLTYGWVVVGEGAEAYNDSCD